MKLHYGYSSSMLLFLFLFSTPHHHAVNGKSTIRGGDTNGEGGDKTRLLETDTDEQEQKQEVDDSADVPGDEDVVTSTVQTENVEDSSLFTPAQSIEFFKSGIDSETFEWINADNVKAGGTTCGFLYPPLGYEPDIDYPKIKVYICMQFATIQPAPKGNLFVHLGGPFTLSDSVDYFGSSGEIGQDNVDNYNIISIDQRGMGRSEPSFVHEECAVSGYGPVNGLTYTEDEIQLFLDQKKEVVESCWSCEDCGFHFNATKADNTVLSLNFLEFAGTHHLVEDIFMFMGAIGAPSLSLYGVSYGTTVMATFATIFPSYVDKFVIDSNVLPGNQLDEYAITDAIGADFRLNYIIYTCWAARLKDFDACPVDDLPQCLQDLEDLVYLEKGQRIEWADIFIEAASNTTFWGPACEAAAVGELSDEVKEYLGILDSPQKRSIGYVDCNSYDQPTNSYGEGDCYGVPADQYLDLALSIVTGMVNGMDYAGSSASYNDKLFIKTIINFQETYESVSSGPAIMLIGDLSFNYYWPKTIPLPIRGNPEIRGIVSGQQYDYATPYAWTSSMRENFPYTSLLTSQSISHGLGGGYEGPCQQYIARYFEEGYVGFNDGLVCGDPYPYFDNLVR